MCANGSTAELTFFQTLADAKILAHNASPNTSGAQVVEAELVQRYWHNAHMHEPGQQITLTNSVFLSTELTKEMKFQLDGPMDTEIDTVNRADDWAVQ